MFRPTTFLLTASAALVLALASGCDGDGVDVAAAILPAAGALEVPPLGQELFRMFEDEKRDAQVAELPAQF